MGILPYVIKRQNMRHFLKKFHILFLTYPLLISEFYAIYWFFPLEEQRMMMGFSRFTYFSIIVWFHIPCIERRLKPSGAL